MTDYQYELGEAYYLVNQLLNPSFETDSNADGLADNWGMSGAPVCTMESTIVLNGCKSQRITTDAVDEGIYQLGLVAPAGTTKAVAYAWVCRPAAGSDIRVQLWDNTAAATRDSQLLSTGGWQTKVVGANTWYRVVVSSSAIVAGNTHWLLVKATAVTPTVFYADMAFWKWGVSAPPPGEIGDNVEDLVGVPPRSEHHEYSSFYETMDSKEVGDGFPWCEWHFNFLTGTMMNALLGYITGQSSVVSIKTRLNDGSYQVYASAVMHRPKVPDEALRVFGGWSDVVFRFTRLEV